MNPNERIIRLPQVLDLVGMKKTAAYDRIKAGSFPAPIKLGAQASGWLESEVQQWIREQATRCRGAANDANHPAAA